MVTVPRVVIAAPATGQGKTSVATGLLAALRAAGLTVSPHKVGPDYIDPGYHALAAGRAGRNLDPWLVGEDQIVPMFLHGAATPVPADVAVIEGVMGLFDGKAGCPGAAGATWFASTAHVAGLLGAPVVLVVDASGMAASAAALLHGFATFDPATRLGGVIFNKVGPRRHTELLREAAGAAGVPVLGVIQRQEQLTVPSRHLGLIPALELGRDAVDAVSALAAVIAASVDLAAVMRLARTAAPLHETAAPRQGAAAPSRDNLDLAAGRLRQRPAPRLAMAAGRAFTFGYAEHAELLAAAGAEVVAFDPLREERLPGAVDGMIIGGGFPEEHAAQLSANARLRAEVAALAASGAPVIAECAGLLYLARSLDGHPMCGVLGVDAEMTGGLTLGYRDAVAASDSPLGPAGTRAHGHEFHRTAVTGAAGGAGGAGPAWRWKAAGTTGSGGTVSEGFVRDGVHASYLHTHWNGIPGAAEAIVAAARRHQQARTQARDQKNLCVTDRWSPFTGACPPGRRPDAAQAVRGAASSAAPGAAWRARRPGGVHARDERGHDPPHLLPQGGGIAPAGDDQVVGGAEEGESQRLGVGVGAGPAELLLGVQVGGEVPLDVTEPARAARVVIQRHPQSGFRGGQRKGERRITLPAGLVHPGRMVTGQRDRAWRTRA